jgi:transcriptional antiterminator RfaH
MYWACARLEPRREAVAAHFLAAAGYQTYLPRLRERRRRNGHLIETRPLLFPGYGFVLVVGGWWQARWSPGVANLIMNGAGPAHVPDNVVAEIRARERNGLIELPRRALVSGDRVRVMQGPLRGLEGLYGGQAPRERVAILLSALGRVVVKRDDVEPIAAENHRWRTSKRN